MAFRLNKPLTVRLFPVPGLSSGDMTAFESDDLSNIDGGGLSTFNNNRVFVKKMFKIH